MVLSKIRLKQLDLSDYFDSQLVGVMATPPTPAPGYNKLYFKNDELLYKLDSSGVETIVGGSTPGGGLYQLQYNDNGAFGGSSSMTIDSPANLGAVTIGFVHQGLITDACALKLQTHWGWNAFQAIVNIPANGGDTYAIAGRCLGGGTQDMHIGGRFEANGGDSSIGVYGIATGGVTNNWAGYFEGSVKLNGGVYNKVETLTASGSATINSNIIECNSATSITVSLPTAVGCLGLTLDIGNINTGAVTIQAYGTETISGTNTKVLGSQWLSLTLYSNGANWVVI